MNETTHRALPPITEHSLHAAGVSWRVARERAARHSWGIDNGIDATRLAEIDATVAQIAETICARRTK
jgi:hypothetical protein